MDKVYLSDIPAARRALEQLQVDFAGLDTRTDWRRLRVGPLLRHVRTLQRVLEAPEFAGEVARLRRGVSMFRADLVYLRENIQALQAIVAHERQRSRRGAGSAQARRRAK